jgi:hypothetical protein
MYLLPDCQRRWHLRAAAAGVAPRVRALAGSTVSVQSGPRPDTKRKECALASSACYEDVFLGMQCWLAILIVDVNLMICGACCHCTHACIQTHVCLRACIAFEHTLSSVRCINVCIYMHTYTYIPKHIYIPINTHLKIYVRIYMYIYIVGVLFSHI